MIAIPLTPFIGSSPWPTWQWPVLATALLTASIVAIALFIVARRRRVLALNGLTDAVNRLGSGEFDLKVYTSGAAEWSELARAIGNAGEELSARFANLEGDRRQLRAILGSMAEGVVSIDSQERIAFVNEQAARLLDVNAALVVGKRIWEVVRNRQFDEIVSSSLQADEPLREELDWHGASDRRLAVTAARLRGGSANGAVVVVHDITELRRLERIRQEFVANVSHELKTPLAIIKLNVETLLDGAAEDAEHRPTFLAEIDHQADRLNALILDLLRLARIESGAPTLEWDAIPLESLANECIDRHADRAKAKGQRIEAKGETGSEAITVWADRESCETILDNLVDNAIKYTPHGGAVMIRWSSVDGNARLDVEDTGIGIPVGDQPHVFERFYRVDKARSRAMGGTGLGLSIVKHLVAAMNGSVEVRGNSGKGTTFSVLLPAAGSSLGIPTDPSPNLHNACL